MKPEMDSLLNQLADAQREVDRLERAIGDFRRACKHVRTVGDPNWCAACDGIVPMNYEQPREYTEP